MGNILSRIQEIASNEGITIGALERKIGASKGVLSRAINNGTDIQSKWVQLIVENYPQYSTRWLMLGDGCMLENEPDKQIRGFSAVKEEKPMIEMRKEQIVAPLIDLIKEKDRTIQEQAEEIGRLKEQIRQMTIEKGKHVSDAATTHTANVG